MTKFRHALPTILFALLLVGAVPTRADIVCVPDTVSLTAATPAVDLVWSYTGGGSANVAGYSIVVAWDPALVTPTFARPDNGPFAGAATFFVVPLGSGQARVDAAIGGADPGIASGELGKVTLTGVGGQAGETALDLTLSALRDPDNLDVTGVTALDAVVLVDIGAPVVAGVAIANSTLPHTDDFVKDGDALVVTATVTDEDPGFGASGITADLSGLGGAADAAPDDWTAPVATWNVAAATCTPADGTITVTVTATDSGGNVGTGSDGITADNTPPTALQDLTVLPGHEKIHLAWTDAAASDANPWQVVFRTATWDDYPAYATAAPAYPADHLAGDAVFDTTGTAADWAVTPRAIRYVAGFVTDMVLQTGPAGPTSTGRATNYWLGDVAGAAGYDGSVDIIHDITLLGTTYGLADTAAAYLPECNVGPTDTRSPRGIPEPGVDAEVGFEDMMVFALNYTVVTPGAKAAESWA